MIRFAIRCAVLVRSALRGLRGSLLTSGVAVGTIAIALLLVGVFALLVGNMRGLLAGFADEMQVTAYLVADLPRSEQQQIARRVETVEGVAGVTLVTEEEALMLAEEARKALPHKGLQQLIQQGDAAETEARRNAALANGSNG